MSYPDPREFERIASRLPDSVADGDPEYQRYVQAVEAKERAADALAEQIPDLAVFLAQEETAAAELAQAQDQMLEAARFDATEGEAEASRTMTAMAAIDLRRRRLEAAQAVAAAARQMKASAEAALASARRAVASAEESRDEFLFGLKRRYLREHPGLIHQSA